MFGRSLCRLRPGATLVLILGSATCGCAQQPPTDEQAWAAFTRATPTPPEATVRYTSPGSTEQELEIYSPPVAAKPAKPRPVLILVHGGGWTGGTREALAPHARYFAARGWVCVNVSYRLAGQAGATIQSAQEDVRTAFDWVRGAAAQRGWDAKHIVALGESAGGQLVCALGVLPPEPQRWRAHSLVLINPVIDLTTLSWAQTLPGVREAPPIDAKNPAGHPAYVASPLFYLTREAPPILLLHGRKDTSVPFSQAEAFVARARAVGAKVDLIALDDTGHAFLLREYGSPESIHERLKQIAEFLGEP